MQHYIYDIHGVNNFRDDEKKSCAAGKKVLFEDAQLKELYHK